VDAASGTVPRIGQRRSDRRLERVIKCRHEAPAPEAPIVAAAALAMRASRPRLGGDATRERWQLLPALREDASPLTGVLGGAYRGSGRHTPDGLWGVRNFVRTASTSFVAATGVWSSVCPSSPSWGAAGPTVWSQSGPNDRGVRKAHTADSPGS
jgi:hypothetical protein